MIKVNNVRLNPDYTDSDFKIAISKKLKIKPEDIKTFSILKKSLDARKKNDIKFIFSFKVNLKTNENKVLKRFEQNEVSLYIDEKYLFKKSQIATKPLIVGSGPAGLFCAYVLIKSGLRPIIVERGERIEDRVKSVENFFKNGILSEESNIQFGEGGAGTFSDGKLNTGISDKRIKLVLETFVEFGAPKEILYEQKPHIGTDILRKVIINMRKFIIDNGGEFLFSTKFIDFTAENNKIKSAIVNQNNEIREIKCDSIILAIGHSARDTFYMLYDKKLKIEQKPFAVGVRIEHKQELINKIQYGENFNNKHLPVADYKTFAHLNNGRTVYSFCMCPGGYVVAAASENGMIATNGMSNYLRDSENANSAVLVNITPEDFGSTHPLAGIEFQRNIEKNAYNISKSYKAPAQTVDSFLFNGENKIKSVKPTYRPDVVLTDLNKVLPEFICNSLKEGLLLINEKLNGFTCKDALLIAPETRSSSPVKINRNEFFCANIDGLYPCGEGAGYAGGITSAAVDGIKVAEKIIERS
ncbi:MAG: hypothetical protein IJD90_06340 [Clostridia bacterium]|nr:hypothetical protein [Clostridia bacterium]